MATSSTDYKKEWFSKAQVDYYSAFINLWLACNSWYNFHYSLSKDRDHINKVKSDFTNTNKIYKEFERIFLGEDTKERKSLFSNIEQLHFAIDGRNLMTANLILPLGFNSFLLDYSQKAIPAAYTDVVYKNARTSTGKIKASISGVDLGTIVISNDHRAVFAGLFELIYQVRCMLVHGDLEPVNDSHEIVKYCYLILFDLMKSFCS